MDLASPAVELLGFCVKLLSVCGFIVAAVIFLRGQGGGGPWIMLFGAVFCLVGLIPQGLEQFMNYYSRLGYEPPEISPFMYYTFWNWLPDAAGLLFSVGLGITAIQRYGLSKRAIELERTLSAMDPSRRN